MQQSFIRTLSLGFITSTAILSSACSQYSHDYGVGASVGTTGLSLEGKYAADRMITLRGNINVLPFDIDETFDGVDYNAEIDMITAGGFVDVHPFKNGFHLSAGAYAGDKEVDLVGVPGPATNVEIGNTTYTGAEIGTLRGRVEYNDIAPFAGIGFDGFVDNRRHWSLNLRAGVMFVGSPDVTLNAEGGLSSAFPSVQAELQQEAENLQEELDDYRYYPVVSVGLTRRF